MSDLTTEAGEVTFTIQIKRATTGEVETHELVGSLSQEQAQELGLTETEIKE
jgi:hypothetical protein